MKISDNDKILTLSVLASKLATDAGNLRPNDAQKREYIKQASTICFRLFGFTPSPSIIDTVTNSLFN